MENLKNVPEMKDSGVRYVDGKKLAEILSVSPKTIYNNSHKIIGRCKVGGAVRYDLNKVLYTLQSGKKLFGGRQ